MSASAFDIAASGMAAHRAEMDVIAENIAGAGTIRTPGSAPFRARMPALETPGGFSFADVFDDIVGAGATDVDFADGGPAMAPQPADPTPGDDVDPIEQMVSLIATGRAYDADVAALQAAKQMDVEAIDVDRI